MSKQWKKAKRQPAGVARATVITAAAEPVALRICGASEGFELEAQVKAAEGQPRLRKFSMTAYTGVPMQIGFAYPIIVDLEGITVPSQKRPILRDHDASLIVGHTEAIDVSAQRLRVAGVLSGYSEDDGDEDSPSMSATREIIRLASRGFPWTTGPQPKPGSQDHEESSPIPQGT